jgi:hypothetical protein
MTSMEVATLTRLDAGITAGADRPLRNHGAAGRWSRAADRATGAANSCLYSGTDARAHSPGGILDE